MKKMAVVGFALLQGWAYAQQPDTGCQAANAIFGAIFKGQAGVPCPVGTGNLSAQPQAQPNGAQPGRPSFYVDTPENLATIMRNVRVKYGQLDPSKPSFAYLEFCETEMKQFDRYRNVLYSGYDELKKKCEDQTKPMDDDYKQRVQVAAQQTKAEYERGLKADVVARQQKEANDRTAIIAELRAGKRAPTNCTQYMAIKGYENPENLSAPVMRVAYQAPTGVGKFAGVITQMDGNTMALSGRVSGSVRNEIDPPDNTILLVTSDTRVINGEGIQVGALVQGYATQVGKRTVKLASGQASTVAEIRAICVAR